MTVGEMRIIHERRDIPSVFETQVTDSTVIASGIYVSFRMEDRVSSRTPAFTFLVFHFAIIETPHRVRSI